MICKKCDSCNKFISNEDKLGKCANCNHNIVYHPNINLVHNDPLRIFFEITQINKNLFMGSIISAMDETEIRKHNITHIVNSVQKQSKKWDTYKEIDGIKYFYLDINESKSAVLEPELIKLEKFLDEAIEDSGKILIHCLRGISRSGALITGYMMRKYNLTFDEAYNAVKQKRKICSPNENLLNQLRGLK